MANKFWVGNGGTWDNTTTHWSATSGGAGGASVPTSVDSVFFDANSFTIAGQTVTINAFTASCLDMDWTGVLNSPTFANNGYDTLVWGNLTFNAAMSVTMGTDFHMRATSGTKTINTAGLTLACQFIINGVGGTFNLSSNLTTTNQFTHLGGTFNASGFTITCGVFYFTGTSVRALNLGASIINCSGQWSATTTTNLTFNAGTSTINMTGNTQSFIGGGLTYNNVTFSGTPSTISGSNTFNTLTFTAGKTVKLTSGTTQTVTNLIANGTITNLITIQSVTSGSAATISKASGVTAIRNTSLKDITATGGAAFYALGTTNVSGNTGWTYQMLIKQEKLNGTEMALYHIDSNGVMQKVSG